LVCAKDVGTAFGFSDAGVDVCVAPEYLRPDLNSADADRIWIAESAYRFRRLVSPTRVPASTVVLGADFDGDKFGDLLVYAEGVQLAQIWFGLGDGTFSSSEFPLPGALYVPAVGNLDGDGRSDILWYGPGAVLDEVWRANQDRTFKVDPTSIKGSAYRPVIADFDGDGPGDIFWYGPGAERDSVWWGSAFAQVSTPGINWFATALPGDFDGDSRADLLFAFPGEAEHYLLPGSKDRLFPSYFPVELPALWPAGSADFDGDGRVDLLSKSSEVIDVRYQRGPSAFARVPMPLVNGDAVPVSLDVDGDGKTDIYWRRP
jgi:hypothetical protein